MMPQERDWSRSTEIKAAAILILIYVVFGLVQFLNSGVIIFPFLLNVVLVAFYAVWMLIRAYKDFGKVDLPLVLICVFALLNISGDQWLLSFFLNGEDLYRWFSGGTIEVLRLIGFILLIISLVHQGVRFTGKLTVVAGGYFLLALAVLLNTFTAVYWLEQVFMTFAFVFMVVANLLIRYKMPAVPSIRYNLVWILMTALELSITLTEWFN
jgi:hypothetical protein